VVHLAGSKIEGLGRDRLSKWDYSTVSSYPAILRARLLAIIAVVPHGDFGLALIASFKSWVSFPTITRTYFGNISLLTVQEECLLLKCCAVLVFGATPDKIPGVCQDHRRLLLVVYFKYVVFICFLSFMGRGESESTCYAMTLIHSFTGPG
jgi:hypothetical protein